MNVFSCKRSSGSWLYNLRNLCLQYQLPHPLTLLNGSLSKASFKTLAKKHVINYWEIKLREEATPLLSLRYFKPAYMSLSKPHPIFTTAGSSPYEVTKASIQALFLSGRYRTERLSRHWTQNSEGFCLTPSCVNKSIYEDEEHILLHCESLSSTRQNLVNFTANYANSVPLLSTTLLTLTRPEHLLYFQFLLDCSVLPQVISLAQVHGEDVLYHLFKVTRTWCYSLHRDRLKILGRWTKH